MAWLTATDGGGKISIKAKENTGNSIRNASVIISNDDESLDIEVKQNKIKTVGVECIDENGKYIDYGYATYDSGVYKIRARIVNVNNNSNLGYLDIQFTINESDSGVSLKSISISSYTTSFVYTHTDWSDIIKYGYTLRFNQMMTYIQIY